ncbi:unnamed protein product [Mytilus coruscus]|uniref:CCHC-type domain-containing protein n=1 Tax=Mytilus coruscus TaxID=42192 RepID=A0A6J8B1A1_MYTCO|nr:unnamed protein product [Mytilus coruscus]
MRRILSDKNVSVETLISSLNQMVLRENERLANSNGFRGKINKIEVTEESDALGDLKEEVKRELAEIRQLVKNAYKPTQPQRQPQQHTANKTNRERKPGCPQCQQTGNGGQCSHCWICGSSEHFKAGCENRFKSKEKQDRQDTSIRKVSMSEMKGTVFHLSPKHIRTLVRLVGSKCEVDCSLYGKECRLLWDTEAQVSIIPVQWLKEKMNETQIRPLNS